MHLIAIGRLRSGPEFEIFDRYNTRLQPRLKVVEVPEERGGPVTIKRSETAALVRALPKGAFVVPLDLGGTMLSSAAFAERLDLWHSLSCKICFVVGGAEGLASSVISNANYVLSLGMMTWPHFLARAMLAEQIYRAQAILRAHPYHRSGRP